MKIKIDIIRGRNQSDRTCFCNITNWLPAGWIFVKFVQGGRNKNQNF